MYFVLFYVDMDKNKHARAACTVRQWSKSQSKLQAGQSIRVVIPQHAAGYVCFMTIDLSYTNIYSLQTVNINLSKIACVFFFFRLLTEALISFVSIEKNMSIWVAV